MLGSIGECVTIPALMYRGRPLRGCIADVAGNLTVVNRLKEKYEGTDVIFLHYFRPKSAFLVIKYTTGKSSVRYVGVFGKDIQLDLNSSENRDRIRAQINRA